MIFQIFLLQFLFCASAGHSMDAKLEYSTCIKTPEETIKQHGFDDVASRVLMKIIKSVEYEWLCLGGTWHLKRGSEISDFNKNLNLDPDMQFNPREIPWELEPPPPLSDIGWAAIKLLNIQENKHPCFKPGKDGLSDQCMRSCSFLCRSVLKVLYLLESYKCSS